MYASLLYFYSHFKDKGDKEKIRKDLLKYCGLDTEGMVYIIKELRGVVNG
jgi:hypothetical protein